MFFEFVRPGGTLVDSDVGNTFIPGHAIKSMWFMERVCRKRPERAARMERAKDISRWHLEQGWDAKLEGLFPTWHAKGGPPGLAPTRRQGPVAAYRSPLCAAPAL